jgi:hypothetical protein
MRAVREVATEIDPEEAKDRAAEITVEAGHFEQAQRLLDSQQ